MAFSPSASILLVSLASLVLYTLVVGTYRLLLAPICRIPGPLLAKLTYGYEFYYDVINRGQYIWKIRELHETYGPVVRISPEEVHILDAEFYDEIYSGSTRKRNKWEFVCNSHGVPESAFGTSNHDLHRMRRAALNPFFSKQKVRALQPKIENVVENLLARFEEFSETKKPLPMSDAFAALTYDIAYEYSFGRNDNHVKAQDFAPGFRNVSQKGGNMVHMTKHFPWLHALTTGLPEPIANHLDPDLAALARVHKDIEDQLTEIHNNPADKASGQTIFHEILNNESLPPSEKAPKRLWQDGYVTVVAGTLTTADALTWAVYGLLSHPSKLQRLKTELQSAIPDPLAAPSLVQLENLPYLTAVIYEALRLSNGVSMRLSRIDPEKPIIYSGHHKGEAVHHTLPPGTPISMTGILIHYNSKYFSDPLAFQPARWMPNPHTHALTRYLVPFTRGTRQCLGMNLAWAEMYLAVAMIFRRYGSREVSSEGDLGALELYEFDYKRDLEIVGDGALPLYSKESKGVRVVVSKA